MSDPSSPGAHPAPFVPYALAAGFVALAIWSIIEPASTEVWVAEMGPVLTVYLLLVLTWRKFRFSNTAYVLMAMWLYWHTVGAHYTFALVPFDFFNHLIGASRNEYDRVGHYIIGFYAFAVAEWLLRRRYCGPWLATAFGLTFIMSIAAAYEIFEWQYAVREGGEAGVEFLGAQGDIWDAQQDMLADTMGAITGLVLFWLVRPHKSYR
jgi:putative membrane protein